MNDALVRQTIRRLVEAYYEAVESFEEDPQSTSEVLYLVKALAGKQDETFDPPLCAELRAIMRGEFPPDHWIWTKITAKKLYDRY